MKKKIKKEEVKKEKIKEDTSEGEPVRIKKARKSIRVGTGIANLDPLIEGGLEENSAVILVGGSGSGKSIFATQFLLEGMKKGENCLYVTFEEKKEQFFENMRRFGWNLAEYEKKGLFTFLEYTPHKVKTMLEEGGGTVESIVVDKKISRLVIDSITSFALLFEGELEKREAALALFNMIRKWNCTSLLTLEEEQFSPDKSSTRAIEFEADTIIMLYFLRDKGERERFIGILKMRGTKHSEKVYRYSITDKGIALYKKPATDFPLTA